EHRERRGEQLAAEPIADLPELLERRHESWVVGATAPPSRPDARRAPPERPNGSLAMTACRTAVLIKDPTLRRAVADAVPRPHDLRVFLARLRCHDASSPRCWSVTPFLRHRPSSG